MIIPVDSTLWLSFVGSSISLEWLVISVDSFWFEVEEGEVIKLL